MRVFVTGANGFIGQAFCRTAISRGHEVLGLIRNSRSVLPEGCRQVIGSMEEMPWKEIEQFSPDTLLHLAWITTPGVNFHSPLNSMFVEKSGETFLRLAELGVEHLAGTGTFIEYASSLTPLREDDSPLAPLYPYSQAKAETLLNLREIATLHPLSWSWFRVFNAFGQGEGQARMISATMLALAGGRAALIKTPDSVRDYLHVTDVAEGMVRSLEQRQNGPVNIGCGTGLSIFDLACLAAEVVGVPSAHVHRLDPPAVDLMPVAIANNSKLRSTGWAPQVTLHEGLQQLWSSLKSNAALP